MVRKVKNQNGFAWGKRENEYGGKENSGHVSTKQYQQTAMPRYSLHDVGQLQLDRRLAAATPRNDLDVEKAGDLAVPPLVPAALVLAAKPALDPVEILGFAAQEELAVHESCVVRIESEMMGVRKVKTRKGRI